jgi:uncharacterized membrane protein AbrB (regulator of aidB expression)
MKNTNNVLAFIIIGFLIYFTFGVTLLYYGSNVQKSTAIVVLAPGVFSVLYLIAKEIEFKIKNK